MTTKAASEQSNFTTNKEKPPMQLNEKLLKNLLIAFWISLAVAFVAAFFDPEEVLAAEESMGMGVLGEGLEIGFGLGLLVLTIYSSVALYQLKSNARTFFAVATALSFIFSLLVGYMMVNPVSYFADQLGSLICGGILLLVYSEEGRKIFIEASTRSG